MSLINKVLTDLESRTDGATSAEDPRRIYEGLRPTLMVRKRPSRWMLIALTGAAAAAGATAGWQFWAHTAARREAEPVRASVSILPPAQPVRAAIPILPPVASLGAAATPAPVAGPPAVTQRSMINPATPSVAPVSATPVVAAPSTGSTRPPPAHVVPRAPRSAHQVRPHSAVQRPASAWRPKPAPAPLAPNNKGASPTDVSKTALPLTPKEQAENDYRAGVRAWQQGKAEAAETQLQAALAQQADYAKARELFAAILISQGHPDQAQSVLEHGLALSPTHYGYALLLARLYLNSGAEAKAIHVLERVHASAQADPEYLGLLAVLYQRAARYDDAIVAYRSALALRPQEGRWWMGLGICLEATKNSVGAAEAYRRARTGAGMTPALLQYVEQRLAAIDPAQE